MRHEGASESAARIVSDARRGVPQQRPDHLLHERHRVVACRRRATRHLHQRHALLSMKLGDMAAAAVCAPPSWRWRQCNPWSWVRQATRHGRPVRAPHADAHTRTDAEDAGTGSAQRAPQRGQRNTSAAGVLWTGPRPGGTSGRRVSSTIVRAPTERSCAANRGAGQRGRAQDQQATAGGQRVAQKPRGIAESNRGATREGHTRVPRANTAWCRFWGVSHCDSLTSTGSTAGAYGVARSPMWTRSSARVPVNTLRIPSERDGCSQDRKGCPSFACTPPPCSAAASTLLGRHIGEIGSQHVLGM